MKILRTPDSCFEHLAGYPFAPNYLNVPSGDGEQLRIHYLDEGPSTEAPVLLLHGEPSWSYLYRKMIPLIVDAGHRVVAPDLIGFGRSDKPADTGDYTFERHLGWLDAWLQQMDLTRITLVCQDWGGLLGLRLVAAHPDRFGRVVAANTGLPTGDQKMPDAFLEWRRFSAEVDDFNVGAIIQMGCAKAVDADVVAAYDAPFPDDTFKAGARVFPSLVPISPDDPAALANKTAWQGLMAFENPFLTAFSDKDPITRGGDKVFLDLIPGTRGQTHTTIEGGGHFLQEDCGEDFARVVVDFIDATR